MTEREFIRALEGLGFETGEAAVNAALAAALGLPFENALAVHRRNQKKERERRKNHDSETV